MKNIFLVFSVLLFAGYSFGQVKVHSNGDVAINNTTGASRAMLDINQLSPYKPNARIGNLTFQSIYNNLAYVGNNIENRPAGLTSPETGSCSWMQFLDSYNMFRVYDGGIGGQTINVANIKQGFVVNKLGKVGINMPSTAPNPAYDLHVTGTAAKTSAGSDWIVISDKRLKQNIKPFKDGIETLMKIKPVSYEYNGKAGTTKGEVNIGLIAQEMQSIAPYTVRKYNYFPTRIEGDQVVEEKSKSKDYLSLDNSPVRYILVNAVQEQQQIIMDQQVEIDLLKEKLDMLDSKIHQILSDGKIDINSSDSNSSKLYQNIPNPFESNTFVKYKLSDQAKEANLNVLTVDGKLIKTYSIDTNELASGVNLDISNIQSGTYLYQLIVDDRIVSAKKMIKL